mmetsp:Transcript_3113/g.4817  ORF Transcript_3113/g.4817 Transcript_3113/m.4817 type:complete len:81 (-) Transcript_3113:494-736(-)
MTGTTITSRESIACRCCGGDYLLNGNKRYSNGAPESKLINEKKGTAIEDLCHDVKVAGVLSTLTSHLHSLQQQHEEAANM